MTAERLAKELNIGRGQAEAAVRLLDEGNTVPFIARYRKEATGGLTDEQFTEFLIRGCRPEVLLAYEETPGASSVLREWMSRGYEVSVITGRPFSQYGPSREWLDRHGLKDVPLYCLNKYGREGVGTDSGYNLEPDDFYRMDFDFAVEDSPKAFPFFRRFSGLQVLVFDRPWNRDCVLPGDNYTRCRDWESIRKAADRRL